MTCINLIFQESVCVCVSSMPCDFIKHNMNITMTNLALKIFKLKFIHLSFVILLLQIKIPLAKSVRTFTIEYSNVTLLLLATFFVTHKQLKYIFYKFIFHSYLRFWSSSCVWPGKIWINERKNRWKSWRLILFYPFSLEFHHLRHYFTKRLFFTILKRIWWEDNVNVHSKKVRWRLLFAGATVYLSSISLLTHFPPTRYKKYECNAI